MVRPAILIIVIPALVIGLAACDQKMPFNGSLYNPPYDGLAPPTNLHTQVLSESEVRLSWTDNSTQEVDFKLERRSGNEVFDIILLANSTTYKDSGLTQGQTYTYTVFALGGSVTSLPSNQATATTFTTPVLTTLSTTNITSTTARSGGSFISLVGTAVVVRGVCWSLVANPTINDFKTADGSGNGSFTSTLTGLIPNTTYYVKAYATNGTGTGYGNQVSFTTLP